MELRPILLASDNPAKRERLAWLVEGLGLQPVVPNVVQPRPEVHEESARHRDNAVAKALPWSRTFRGLTIASDGGLVVPSLGERWRSLDTRRFAGDVDDLARASALAEMVAPLPVEERTAYWIEAVALADDGLLLRILETRSGEGALRPTFDPAHIRGGFWVGALLHFPALDKVYAELSPQELERVGDHWSKLQTRVQRFLRSYL